MADPRKPNSQNKPAKQNKPPSQKKPEIQKKQSPQKQPKAVSQETAQKTAVTPNKPASKNNTISPKKKPTQKQPLTQKTDQVRLHEQLLSTKANNSGLRFEIEVAKRFREAGWTPEMQKKIHGYEFDLYEERKDGWQTKYLIVESKNKKIVNAEDITHFLYKVTVVFDNIPKSFSPPTLLAYLCYTGEIDTEAASIAQRHIPSINFLKIDI
jgi:hypothetical protein